MEQQRQGSIPKIFVLFLLLCGIGVYMFLTKGSRSYDSSKQVIPSPSPSTGGDINKDGVADETDKNIIKEHMGCSVDDDCWKKRIGKTLDGDNPYYVFDLDLNKDGKVGESDLSMIGR